MALRITLAGPALTVQDRGRLGFQDQGFSPAGVMDWRAAALGNLLVGNDRDAAVLEFALAGPTLVCEQPRVLALTGADVHATLDGAPIPTNQAVSVPAGSVLSVGRVRRGVFGYLAISGGGVDTPPVMGSRSTSVRYGLGGLEGRALRAGDVVPLAGEACAELPAMEARAVFAEDAFYEWDAPCTWVRLVAAGGERACAPESVEALFSEPFTVSSKSDRMGFRLTGPKLRPLRSGGIVSAGIALGSVQVPPSGQPIVVLADHQTTGGYAKIGTVATCDLPRLVQCPAGRQVRFERVTVAQAQRLLRDDVSYLQGLAAGIEREATRTTRERGTR